MNLGSWLFWIRVKVQVPATIIELFYVSRVVQQRTQKAKGKKKLELELLLVPKVGCQGA